MSRTYNGTSFHFPPVSLSKWRLYRYFNFSCQSLCLLPCLLPCFLFSALNSLYGQVESYALSSPEIIEVDAVSRDAFQQLDRGNYEEALIQFNQLLESNPYYISALMGKAKCLFELGDYPQAFDSYLKVVERDDSDVYALEGLGNTALYLNQFNRALNYYRQAISIYPENSTVYYSMAVAHLCQNDFERASEYLKTAILIHNKNGLEAPYSLLLSYVCYALTNSQSRTDELLKYIKSFNFSQTDNWPIQILSYIQGEIESTALLASVVSREQEIEAHTYIGFKLLFEGMKERAEQHLDWVRSIKDYRSIETIIANNLTLEPKA